MHVFNKREVIKNLILEHRTLLSDFDIFQRVYFFVHKKNARAEQAIHNFVPISDRVEMSVDALVEVFKDDDLKNYVEMINSPLFKKVIGISNRWEKEYKKRVKNMLVLMTTDKGDMDKC